MKRKNITAILAAGMLSLYSTAYAQEGRVGINTTDPKTTFDVNGKIIGTGKLLTTDMTGLQAPRLTREELTAKGDMLYGADQKGALIYVTDITGGNANSTSQRINISAVGYYYFDGIVWQAVANGASAAATEPWYNVATGAGATANTQNIYQMGNVGIGTATPLNAMHVVGGTRTGLDGDAKHIFAYVNNSLSFIDFKSNNSTVKGNIGFSYVDNHMFINTFGTNTVINTLAGNVGIGNTAPNAKLDIRKNTTSTSDPGAGFLGIGTTSVAAPSAGAGAVRYSTASGGQLEYSNGIVWNTLTSTVTKCTVVARKTSPQTAANFSSTPITDWIEDTDTNNNFDPATGVFTAPRAGNYVVSFSYNFASGVITAGTQVEAILVPSVGVNKKNVVAFPAGGTSQAGAAISFTLKMAAGETVYPVIWHSTGTDKVLRVGSGADDGFVNFSVAEL